MLRRVLAHWAPHGERLPAVNCIRAVEKGIVDAYEIGGPDWNRTMGFHEVSTHVGTPGIHSPIGGGTHVLVNHDSWAKLPDDLKVALDEAWKATSQNDYLDSLKMDAQALEAWRDVDGMILYTVGDELQRDLRASRGTGAGLCRPPIRCTRDLREPGGIR
jgi:TRAP-type mannitol/chloroaromatic compound transport system substrate-binding protein